MAFREVYFACTIEQGIPKVVICSTREFTKDHPFIQDLDREGLPYSFFKLSDHVSSDWFK